MTLAIEREPDRSRRDPWMENVVASPWVHADQDAPAPALTLPIRPIDAKELLVIVDEGDNSPLPLVSARLLLPSYRLRLFRERGAALRLAYGRDDLSPPRYDLALLAPQLIGVAATDVVPGAEQAAPPAATSVLMSPRVFWGVLVVAVLVLMTLLVRLMRKSDAEPDRRVGPASVRSALEHSAAGPGGPAHTRVARKSSSRASRAHVRSRPSHVRISNSPGLMVRPVTATRVA